MSRFTIPSSSQRRGQPSTTGCSTVSLKELADELEHLDHVAPDFVPGKGGVARSERAQADLDDDEIMEDWQVPLMRAMAEIVCRAGGDVLEIGYGRGIASSLIQEAGVSSHTVVECNDHIVERFRAWRKTLPERDIRLLHGLWQEKESEMGRYDGIFFHTYPLDEQDFVDQVVQSSTFAEHFFETAARHLKPAGVLTYLANEADSLSRGHQRRLFELFEVVTLRRIVGLDLPEDTRDSHWQSSMVIVEVRK